MDLSSGAALSPVVSLPGGRVFDAWGSSQSPRPMVRLPYSCLLTGTESAMQTALNVWYAKVGKRGSLVRAGGDASEHSTTARLVSVDTTRGKVHKHHLPLTMAFDVMVLPWVGADGSFVALAAGSPCDLPCSYTSNAPEPAITITVKALGAAITSVAIDHATAAYHLVWAGTLASGKTLTINCGTMSVLNDGANAYSGFSLHATHAYDEWMVLSPVMAAHEHIAVSWVGAATADVGIVFHERWS
jgi:hypothetical protein